MKLTEDLSQNGKLTVQNIGGIDETEVEFSPGVTILTGRNATNRTSLLQALMAGLGSDHVSLKADADEGHVELTFGDQTYTRTLSRTPSGVATDGDPYLDSETANLGDLFSFLLESNEARRAVATNQNLRELIMRPIDTDAIQAEIDDLQREKRTVDDKLEEIGSLEQKLPDLERQRTSLENELNEKRERLAEKEAEIEEADANVQEQKAAKSEIEEPLDKLQKKRSTLQDVRFNMQTEEQSLDALKGERDEIEAELADLSDEPIGDIESIVQNQQRLRDRKQGIESTLNELQSIIQFNEQMLEGTSSDVVRALQDTTDDGEGLITDKLIEDGERVVCWTCGSDVDSTEIQETVDRLLELRREKSTARSEIRAEIEELEERKRAYEANRDQRSQLSNRMQRVESEIESREEKVEELLERRTELEGEIEQFEEEIEAQDSDENDALLELHREANELQFEVGRSESNLEDVESEIASIEERLAEGEELEGRRADIQAKLKNLRSRIDRIEATAVTQFNEHMAEVLELLEYANLERIWIERKEQEARAGRQQGGQSTFELHVVRSTETGTTYEDTIDHLSESEREVTGLVFGLAGYLVHELYEKLPFIILDSLEAIDSERIAKLIDYLAEYTEYLAVALLPEDATALDSDYQRLMDI